MKFYTQFKCWGQTRISLKFLLVMKLIIVFLITAFLQVSLAGYAQKVTLSEKNVSLEQVFRQIRSQTGYNILCDADLIKVAQRVDIQVKNASIEEALEKCLAGQALTYTIKNNTIIVQRKPVPLQPQAPPGIIKGKVSDNKGITLPGVTVKLEGAATQTTSTDANGNYNFTNLPSGSYSLNFTYLGFTRTRREVNLKEGQESLIDVSLMEEAGSLDEVVVVAYGTQKRTSITAAVSTLSGEDIASIPVSNLSNALGGRIPGVIVRQGSGEPGKDGSSIYIRGISSTGRNQPLVIVDGIPRSFNELDPNIIQSFTVLKDAAAVAPFGVAGANGVILVTTKRGETGAPSLTYNGYAGFQNPTKVQRLVTPYQFAILKNAASANEGVKAPYDSYALQKFQDGTEPDVFPVEDVWETLTNKNVLLTNHNIEVSGGSERIKYYSSLGYQYQAGLWPSSNDNKYNVAINLDANVTKTTKISFSINGRQQKTERPALTTSRNMARLFELYGYSHPARGGALVFSNGMYGKFIMGSIFNTGYAYDKTSAIFSQLSIEQELSFIPGLKFKGSLAYDPTFNFSKTWLNPVQLASIDTTKRPYVIKDGVFGQTKSSLVANNVTTYQLTPQLSLDYNRSFGKNNIGALAVFESKSNEAMGLGATRLNYNLSIDEMSMGSSSPADMSNSGYSSLSRQMGLAYRLTYDYASKYLFETSGRYDGSYYFAPGNRFGFFPAFSVGWRLSEEDFMKNIKVIDNFKIRGSYGEVGALAGTAFQYLSTYGVSGPAYVFGSGTAVQGVNERSEPNQNITWERAKKTNIGFEISLWKSLLTVEADYFHEKRSNMLVNPDVIVPSEYGIGLSQINAGIMQNQGFDLSIGSSYNFTKDLHISLGGNLTYAKNKLLKVYESTVTFNNPNRRVTGRPLGSQFGYNSLGFFKQEDFDATGNLKSGIAIQPWGKVRPGDIRYEDISGDGKIDNNDLTQIGDSQIPQIIYGIFSNISFKGLSLDLLFQGTGKRDFYLSGNGAWVFYNGMGAFRHNLDYWTPDNTNAKNPRITSAPTVNNTQTSSFWMKDASYLRLKSATLSYPISSILAQKIKMQSAKIYVAGQNLMTWSKIDSYDPEVAQSSGWNYPQQKVISVGLNLTF